MWTTKADAGAKSARFKDNDKFRAATDWLDGNTGDVKPDVYVDNVRRYGLNAIALMRKATQKNAPAKS